MADRAGYQEYREYLTRGKNGHPRAGAANDMDRVGYRVFILPPCQAARVLGYKGNNMIAVLRQKF